jgi:hypothetical protein
MTYRQHGHVPTDNEVAALGYKAFAPKRPPFTPTKKQFAQAAEDVASGDVEELAETAAVVAGWWPELPRWPWAFGVYDDDQVFTNVDDL